MTRLLWSYTYLIEKSLEINAATSAPTAVAATGSVINAARRALTASSGSPRLAARADPTAAYSDSASPR